MHGDRKAGSSAGLAQFNWLDERSKMALELTLEQYEHAVKGKPAPKDVVSELKFIGPEYSFVDFSTQCLAALNAVGWFQTKCSVETFLNRLAGVKIELQKKLFEHFQLMNRRMQALFEGETNSQIVDCEGESIKVLSRTPLQPTPLHTQPTHPTPHTANQLHCTPLHTTPLSMQLSDGVPCVYSSGSSGGVSLRLRLGSGYHPWTTQR